MGRVRWRLRSVMAAIAALAFAFGVVADLARGPGAFGAIVLLASIPIVPALPVALIAGPLDWAIEPRDNSGNFHLGRLGLFLLILVVLYVVFAVGYLFFVALLALALFPMY